MPARYILFIILIIDTFVLTLQTQNISISYSEALILYGKSSPLQTLLNSSFSFFGQNDFSLHLVMIIFHLLSVLLMYKISKEYILKERDRVWFILMFVLLPGVVSSAVIVNSAGMVIFGLLLFIYLYKRVSPIFLHLLLLLYAIADIGFSYLFLALITYYAIQKKKLVFYMFVLYLLNSYLFGFDASGLPTGHFLDTIGVYSAIFTPIIFIYLVYSLYKTSLTKEIDILWYISSVALLVSLILSFRQRVPVEHFAPYLIVGLPIAAKTFIHSYRVRLKRYRKKYKIAFIVSFIFLIANTVIVFFNKELYIVLENPKHHFAYKMHVAKTLSLKLKQLGIKCIDTDDKMQKRLLFYGIKYCSEHSLKELPLNSLQMNVTVSYKNKPLYKGYVTNIYTN
jgi:hypothetical protein